MFGKANEMKSRKPRGVNIKTNVDALQTGMWIVGDKVFPEWEDGRNNEPLEIIAVNGPRVRVKDDWGNEHDLAATDLKRAEVNEAHCQNDLNEAIEGINPEDVIAAWNKVFPNSLAQAAKGFDGGYTFKFYLAKDKSEVSGNIMNNDPLHYSAYIDKDGNWKEYRAMMYIEPPEGSYNVYGIAKLRKKSAKNVTLPQIQKRFGQVKDFVAQNADKLKNVKFDINQKLGVATESAPAKNAETNLVAGGSKDNETDGSDLPIDPRITHVLNKAKISYPGAPDDLSALVNMLGDDQREQDNEIDNLDQYNSVQDVEIGQEETINDTQADEISDLRARIEKLEGTD